jgi:hypothetical protein
LACLRGLRRFYLKLREHLKPLLKVIKPYA